MSLLSKLAPSRRLLFLPPLAIGIAVVAILASSSRELSRIEPREIAKPLKVKRVKSELVPAQATGYGTAKPRRLWTAVAEVGGRIVETYHNLKNGLKRS